MKKLIKLFLMLTLSLLFLVACSEKGKEETKTEDTQKKTLTISWNQDVGFLNPHAYLPDQFITQGMVYEGLVNYGENGEILPSLAESWEISEDGKTYTFHLRKAVKFSDGSDFNANNVKKNFDSIFLNKERHSWFGLTGHISSYRAVDENTFEFVLDEAYTQLYMI